MNENSLSEVQALLKQLSMVAETISARNDQAARRIQASADALGKNVEQIASGGEQLARNALNALGTQGSQMLSQGTEQALNQFQSQMKQSINQAQQLEQVLAQHRRGVVGLTRIGLIVLAIGALLAAGGSAYVAYDRSRVIENAHFGQDILQATNSGAINRCGGKLCVKVGKTPARYSQNPDYVLIEGR